MAYVSSLKGVWILNVSNSSRIIPLGIIADNSPLYLNRSHAISVENDLAYVNSLEGVQILNVSNSSRIILLGSIADNSPLYLNKSHAISVEKDLAYVNSLEGVHILNVSNSSDIFAITYYPYFVPSSQIGSIFVENGYVYVASKMGVHILKALEVERPNITIISPLNLTYSSPPISLIYNVSSSYDIYACWFSLDGGRTNSTFEDCLRTYNLNVSDVREGLNEWIVYANNTLGTESGANVRFFVNRPVDFESNSTTRDLYENSPPYTDVGLLISVDNLFNGVFYNEELVYNLSGQDGASFIINESTGQLKTKPEIIYDYETKNNYSVIVTVNNSVNNVSFTDNISVIINLIERNEINIISPIENKKLKINGLNKTYIKLSNKFSDPEKFKY